MRTIPPELPAPDPDTDALIGAINAELPALVTYEDAIKYTHRSGRTLRRAVAGGELRVIPGKGSARTLFVRESLARWLASQAT